MSRTRLKFVVVDDEPDFAGLLEQALERLGHEAVVVSDPRAVLGLVDRGIDGVITGVELAAMSDLELARAIREAAPGLPIVFLSGSHSDAAVLQESERLGRVVAKMWALARLREIVTDLGRIAAARSPDEGAADGGDPAELARRTPKVKLVCRTWPQVLALCEAQAAGRHVARGPAPRTTLEGDPITVAVALPDELVLAIAGTVVAVIPDPVTGEATCTVALTGLTPDLVSRLRELAGPARPQGGYLKKVRTRRFGKGSSPDLGRPAVVLPDTIADPDRVSEIIIGNLRLRRQIDGLAERMRPRRKPESD